MAGSIPGNIGNIKNRSYQDLAKANIQMLEALKLALEILSDSDTGAAYADAGYSSVLHKAERAAREAIAKAEGK